MKLILLGKNTIFCRKTKKGFGRKKLRKNPLFCFTKSGFFPVWVEVFGLPNFT